MRYSYFTMLLLISATMIYPAHAETLSPGNWSGFYAGGSVGTAFGSADTSASTVLGGAGSYFTGTDGSQIADAGDGKLKQWRPSVGIFGGFGKQFGNILVGIEASANSLSLDDSRTSNVTYLTAPTAAFTLKQSYRSDWQATLRLRLGYARANWLAYVTGGAAVTRVTVDTEYSDDFFANARGQDSSTSTPAGIALGAGGEYLLNKNWSVRGEFLYVDYGRVESSAHVTNPTFPTLSNTVTNAIGLDTQTLSIGLTYHFDGL